MIEAPDLLELKAQENQLKVQLCEVRTKIREELARCYHELCDIAGSPGNLTRRQIEILQMVREGLANCEIGAQLGIAERTVKHHVALLLRKFDVSERGKL